MPDTFTFRESYELLQTNPKSFQEWLKKAGIDPRAQVNRADPRKKYLTKEQLLLLAEQHGRTLPPLDDLEQEDEALRNEELADQLAAAHQQQMERFEQMDRTLAQIVALVQEIASQYHDLLGRVDHLQHLLPQAISSVQELVQSRTDGRSNGAQQERAEPVAMPSAAPPRARAAKPSTKIAKKKKPAKGKRLPRGLMLLRDFASLHQIAMERASATAKSGKITIVRGKWLVNSRWGSEALDATGQQQFYEVFHDRTGFAACDQCPHREHA